MRFYSYDLRIRIVRAAEQGMPKEAVARTFGVALSTVKNHLKRQKETGDIVPRFSPGRPA